MPDLISIGECARELGVNPAVISRMFYDGRLSREDCPRIAGRSVMTREYVEGVVKPLLRRLGYQIRKAEVCHA